MIERKRRFGLSNSRTESKTFNKNTSSSSLEKNRFKNAVQSKEDIFTE